MAFGAKIKLSVNQSNQAEFRREIQSFVDKSTSKTPIKLKNLTIDVSSAQIQSLTASLQEKLNTTKSLTVKINEFNVDGAIQKLHSQLKDMLGSLNISGLKDIEAVFNNSGSAASNSSKLITTLQSAADSAYKSGSKLTDPTSISNALSQYQKICDLIRQAKTEQGAEQQATLQNIALKTAGLRSYITELYKESGIVKENEASLQKIAALHKKISIYASKNPLVMKNSEYGASINSWLTMLSSGRSITDKGLADINDQFANITIQARQAGLEGSTFFGKLAAAYEKFGGWSLITRSMTFAISKFKEMISIVVELDTAMTELRKVTDLTDDIYESVFDRASIKAKELGSTISSVIRATGDFARLGYKIEDAEALAKAAIVYQNVGDGIENINDASSSIISTMKAFESQGVSAMQIVDKFNIVGNNFAISSKGVGDALMRSSAALAAAGNSIDDSIALATGMNAVIQDPDKVGTVLKTASMFLRAAKTEAEDAGESIEGMAHSTSELRQELLTLTGGKVDIMQDDKTFKNTIQIYRELAGVWDKLADVDAANILELIGGKRNATANAALLSNFEEVEKVIAMSSNAEGSALAENKKYLDSIQGRLTVLNATFEKFSANIVDSDIIKSVVSITTGFLELLNILQDMYMLLPLIVGIIRSVSKHKESLSSMSSSQIAGSRSSEKQATDNLSSSVKLLNTTEQDNIVTKNTATQKSKEHTAALLEEKAAVEALSRAREVADTLEDAEVIEDTAQHSVSTVVVPQGKKSVASVVDDVGEAVVKNGGKVAGTVTAITTAFSKLGNVIKVVGSVIKTVGKTFLSSMAITLAIEATFKLIAFGINQYKKATRTIEELNSEYKELSNTMQETTNKFATLKKDVEDIAPRFAELAGGVNKQGKNISLTTDEYEEFLSLQNKITELLPDLVMGYDVDGNPILALANDAKTLKETLEAAVEAQRKLANEQNADKLPDILDNTKQTIGTYKKEIDILKDGLTAYKELKKNSDIADVMPTEYWLNLQTVFPDDLYKTLIEKYTIPDTMVTDWAAFFNSKELESVIAGIEKELYGLESKIQNTWKRLNPVLSSWAQTSFYFNELGSEAQDIALQYVNAIDFSKIDGIETEEDVKEYIEKNILAPLYDLKDDKTAQEAIGSFLKIKTKFETNSIPVDDYIKELTKLIDGLELEANVKYNLKLAFGIVGEDGVENQIASAVNRILSDSDFASETERSRAKANHANKLKDLNSSDLEIAIRLINNGQFTGDWSTFYELIKDEKQVESFTTNMEKLNSELDALQSTYKTLSDAMLEYQENGYFSLDTYQALLELEPKYLACLVNEQGELELTAQKLKNLTAARMQDLAIAKAQSIIDTSASLQGEQKQIEYLTGVTQNKAADKWQLIYDQIEAGAEYSSEKTTNLLRSAIDNVKTAYETSVAGINKEGFFGETVKKTEKNTKDFVDSISKSLDKLSFYSNQLSTNLERIKKGGLGGFSTSIFPTKNQTAFDKIRSENQKIIEDYAETADTISKIQTDSISDTGANISELCDELKGEISDLDSWFNDDIDFLTPSVDTSAWEDFRQKTAKEIEASGKYFTDLWGSTYTPTISFTTDGQNGGSNSGNSLVDTAFNYEGTPYVWGGVTPKGFDCSGFTQYVAKEHGISISRTAAAQYSNDGVHVSKDNLQPGDLVFFKNTGKRKGITHVGIYIGNGKMIHAPGTGKSITTADLSSNYYTNHYAGAKRITPYSTGTAGGAALVRNADGIVAENYVGEYLVDKETGALTYVDTPTLINTSKTDVIGEKDTKKLGRYAKGTVSVETKEIQALEKYLKDSGVDTSAKKDSEYNEKRMSLLLEITKDKSYFAGQIASGATTFDKDPQKTLEKWTVNQASVLMDEILSEFIKSSNIQSKTYEYYNKRIAEGASEEILSVIAKRIQSNEQSLNEMSEQFVTAVEGVAGYFVEKIQESANNFSNTINNLEVERGYIKDSMDIADTSDAVYDLYKEDLTKISEKSAVSRREMANQQQLWYDMVDAVVANNDNLMARIKNVDIWDFFDIQGNLKQGDLEKFLSPYIASGDVEDQAFATTFRSLMNSVTQEMAKSYTAAYIQNYEAEKEAIQTNREIMDFALEIIEERQDKINESLDNQITREEALLDIKEKSFELSNKLVATQTEINKQIASSRISEQYLTPEEYARIFNEEDYIHMTKTIEAVKNASAEITANFQNKVKEAYGSGDLYLIEAITAEYERQMAAQEKIIELEEKNIELKKKELELNNILSEKNIKQMTFVNGKYQWEWVADYDKVRQATEDVATTYAEYNQIQAERSQQLELDDAKRVIDSLNISKEALNASVEDITKEIGNLKTPVNNFNTAIVALSEFGIPSLITAVDNIIDTFSNKFGGIRKANTPDTGIIANTATTRWNGGVIRLGNGESTSISGGVVKGTRIETPSGTYIAVGKNSDGTTKFEKIDDGYSTGTKSAQSGTRLIDEDGYGSEVIATKEGLLYNFGGGEKVFTAQQTENLWTLSQTPISDLLKTSFKINPTASYLGNETAYNLYGDIIIDGGDPNAILKAITQAINNRIGI